jgi:penicillin-binding protein 1A
MFRSGGVGGSAVMAAARRLVSGARRVSRARVVIWAAAITIGAASIAAISVLAGALLYLYVDRTNLPDLGPFTRFELPTIGHIYDVNGQSLVELARERRRITPYAEIPPVVRHAILAAEDKHFFSHNGVDYLSIPRIVGKVRLGAWLGSLPWLGDTTARDPAMFPQGGSTITQQLVRGLFLQQQMSQERSGQLSSPGVVPQVVSFAIGVRNTNMLLRKGEEIRLSFWVEQRMRAAFGSKRRAKEEIFARYASFVYMGRGQYGFARAAEQYLGRGLTTLTIEDADQAALLAGIMKAPRDYAPTAKDNGPVLSWPPPALGGCRSGRRSRCSRSGRRPSWST